MRRSWIGFVVERLTLAALSAAAALAVFVWLAHAVGEGGTLRLDNAAFRYFQARPDPPLHALMTGVSGLASGWAVTVVSVLCVLALWRRPAWRRRALGLLLAGAGGQGVVSVLKALFHRARPEAIFDSLGYSFPSGHSFAAVTIYGTLAYWLAREASPRQRLRLWAGAIVLIGLIGFSRIYLGVHYASDVAAGFMAGWFWLWGCLAVTAQRPSTTPEGSP